jgi:membrane protease YdiL (CAAX protease family)
MIQKETKNARKLSSGTGKPVSPSLQPLNYEDLKVPNREDLTSALPKRSLSQRPEPISLEQRLKRKISELVSVAEVKSQDPYFKGLLKVLHVAAGVPLSIWGAHIVLKAPIPTGLKFGDLAKGQPPIIGLEAHSSSWISPQAFLVAAGVTAAGILAHRLITRGLNKLTDWRIERALKAGADPEGPPPPSAAVFQTNGNAGVANQLFFNLVTKAPLISIPVVGALGPYTEEVLFRGLPALTSFAKASPIAAGIVTSLVFAALHNVMVDRRGDTLGVPLSPKIPGLGAFKLSLEHFPASQFLMGLTYWGLMQWQGFGCAVMAHALNNTIACFYMVLRARKQASQLP